MATTEAYIFVFIAALLTELAAGLGAIPFFFVKDVSDRWYVILWGFASGIMTSSSLFGLLPEGLSQGPIVEVVGGVIVGVLLVFSTSHLLGEYDFYPQTISEADFRRVALIVGTLTVHSFPEGVAVGVSFANLGVGTGGATVSVLLIGHALFVNGPVDISPESTSVAPTPQTNSAD
ncbi:ZIP family metal transporter [Haladaptatus sp. W1]|uniref:ZIP family metal transporter n=1 Tax=Haladaptatus sp. W1 TaxID=1897478 RepID=UPI001112E7E6|nr:hypothetical protein [Haladaptatus sp. W1]